MMSMENINEIAKEFISIHKNIVEKVYGNSVISNTILIYYLYEVKIKHIRVMLLFKKQ